jgi:outer membrane protein assembly factor BamB
MNFNRRRVLPLNRFLFVLLFATAILLTPVNGTADSPAGWSAFHGPNHQGYVADGQIPSTWTDDDYSWRRKLGSSDVGSPVIAAGKVFYLAYKPDQNSIALEALDLTTGDLLWSKPYPQSKHHLHLRNTYASSTPAVDGQYVFVAWSEPTHTYLKCFDHQGKEIWSRDFGTWQSQHGFGTSPRVHGSMVLLFNSQQADQLKPGDVAGNSRMIAVDRRSGETLWETPLQTTRTCYGVPAVYQAEDGRTQIIDANTGNGVFAIDAASGRMLWNLKVFDARCCSTPLIAGDIAIGSSGSGGGGNHLVGVRIPKNAGDQPVQVYRIDRGAPYVPTPVLKDNRLFFVSDKAGIASCIDAQTGDTLWSNRIGGNFGASPIVVGDKMLIISLDGMATILRAGDQFERLGQVDLGGPVGATPAFADGKLILRVGDELRCLGDGDI